METGIDTEHRDVPMCPWCGYENSAELLHPTVTRVVMGCSACNKAMEVTRNTTITFTTKKLFEEPGRPERPVVEARNFHVQQANTPPLTEKALRARIEHDLARRENRKPRNIDDFLKAEKSKP